MLTAKSRETPKIEVERAPSRTKPKLEITPDRVQANTLWHQLATRVQAKLTVSAPEDPYEREADRIADQVLATPAHPGVSGAPPRVQRFSGQSHGQMDAAPASVDQVLASPGRALEPALRQDMEQRFGYHFSRVRVHSGAAAEQSAQDVNAHAYTVGHKMVFGAGRFAPGTHEGRRLIAHELTHVVQQSGADGIRAGQSDQNRGLSPISLHTDAESRARNAAARVARGAFVAPDVIGEAPLGVYAEDGKESGLSTSGSPSFKLGGPPLTGPLKVSAWLIDELIKQGQLSPQMLQLIQSGQIEITSDEMSAAGATGGAPSGASGGGSRNFATEFNALPNRFFSLGGAGLGAGGSDPLGGPKVTPGSPLALQSVATGGYFDPLIGYIPGHIVKWTPPSPSAPQAAGEPNWLQKSLADLKTSFGFSEGLTTSSISHHWRFNEHLCHGGASKRPAAWAFRQSWVGTRAWRSSCSTATGICTAVSIQTVNGG